MMKVAASFSVNSNYNRDNGSSSATCSYAATPSDKPSLRKHRCWQFHVVGAKATGDPSKYERDVLLPFRQRYTSATRLVLSAIDGQGTGNDTTNSNSKSIVNPAAICVEVQFSGPQPCLGPGSLLCALLAGTSVRAHPVQLERGRKKKLRRAGSFGVVDKEASPVASLDVNRRTRQKTCHGPSTTATTATNSDKVQEDGCNNDSGSNCASKITDDDRGPRAQVPSGGGDISNQPIPATRAVTRDDEGRDSTATSTISTSTHSTQDEHVDSRASSVEKSVNVECSPVGSGLKGGGNQADRSSSVDLLGPISGESANYDFRIDGYHWVDEEAGSGSDSLIKSWSAASSQSEEEALQSRVLTCSDWDDLLHSTEGTSGGCPDASAARTNHALGDVYGRGSEGLRSTGEFSVMLSHMECDFEGRADMAPGEEQTGSSLRDPPPGKSCQILISGLEDTRHDPPALTVTAHFWIDPTEKILEVANPIHVDPGGGMRAAVRYPSMQKLWPTVYRTDNIRTVEVDVSINVRSRNREFEHVGPRLKVTYRRPTVQTEQRDTSSRISCRRISDPPRMRFKINSGKGMVAV